MDSEETDLMAEANQSLISKASGLKGKDYLCYALGDVGCCLVFSLVTTVLQAFYTDILMLSPLFIMIMFIGARLWDAINDPIMGRICDTIKVSRWGRYRIWFLYGVFPLSAASILMFVKWPGIQPGSTGMAVYATLTYILFGMTYTMVQIPYGSLASVVTMDDKERSKLSTWRSVGAAFGSLPIMVVSAMCVKTKFDENGAKIGTYMDYKTLIIGVLAMVVASLIMLLLAFIGNKERVVSHPVKSQKGDTMKAIKRLFKSKSMLSISVISMLQLAGQMFIQSYYIYLIKQYFGRGGIWVSLPTILTYLPMAILMWFTPKLVKKFGKKEICAVGMLVASIANFAMFFLKFLDPAVAIYPFLILCFVSGIGLNLIVLQIWAMVSDCSDDIEVKTGSRDDGTGYAFFMFFRKFGQLICAVAVNVSLLAMGYFEGVKNSVDGVFFFTKSQLGLMYDLATLIPAGMFTIMTILLFAWYPLSKSKVADLQFEKEKILREALATNKIKIN